MITDMARLRQDRHPTGIPAEVPDNTGAPDKVSMADNMVEHRRDSMAASTEEHRRDSMAASTEERPRDNMEDSMERPTIRIVRDCAVSLMKNPCSSIILETEMMPEPL